MKIPGTSLIISSRERPELLKDTVNSVLQGNDVPEELVIIDQSRLPNPILFNQTSNPGCEIVYRNVASIGVSRARNSGIKIARHDLLIIIDDDIFVDSSWLTNIVAALTAGGIETVISGQVRPYVNDQRKGFAPSTIMEAKSIRYTGRINKDVLYSANMAIHRAAFESIGLFDERLGAGTQFPGGEDNDLGFRLLEAGFCIQYQPEAVVFHRAWRSKDEYLPLRWNYGLGRGAFYAKYFHLRDPYMLKRMFTDIRNHLLAFPFRLRHQRLEAFGDLILSWGILVGVFRWITTASTINTDEKA